MLIPLFDFTKQFETNGGTLNVGGFLKVFKNNTDTLAPIYEDMDGTTIKSQPVTLDSNGRAGFVYVAAGALYRLEVYSRTGALLWTIEDMAGIGAGGGGGGDPTTITSRDGSVTIEKTGSNYDLSVAHDAPSVLVCSSNPLRSDGPFTIANVTRSQGSNIWLDSDSGYIRANRGWYHVDFNFLVQNTTARNQVLEVGLCDNSGTWLGQYNVDLSYTNQQCRNFGFDFYATGDAYVFQVIQTFSNVPAGITFYLTMMNIHEIR